MSETILRPCPDAIPCPGFDQPVINYSSEAPDPPDFVTTGFFGDQMPPIVVGNGTDGNPLGPWNATACDRTYTSTVSQLDAEMQALAAAYNCLQNNWHGPGPTDNQPAPCCNDEQCCQNFDINGTTSFCIPANHVCAPTCAEANEQAKAMACALGKFFLATLTDMPHQGCADNFYTSTVIARNAYGVTNVLFWDIVSGSLPPGLNFASGFYHDRVTIDGSPTTPGKYTFTLRATNDAGNYVQRVYTICIVGITDTSPLPNGTVGTAYGKTLTYDKGGCGPSVVNWIVSSGALPPGLSLDPTSGNISGTPTTAGTYNFTVAVQA